MAAVVMNLCSEKARGAGLKRMRRLRSLVDEAYGAANCFD